jgi:thymidine kinase
MGKAKLVFEYSVMNAGKTLELLKMNFNYTSIGTKTLLVKSALDTRDTEIVSRIGLRAPCESLSTSEDPYELYKETEATIILVDEAQFLTREQVHGFRKLVDFENKTVVCFGLRSNFKGDLFEGSAALFSRSDKIVESKTVCHCGGKATMVLKFDSETGAVFKTGAEIDTGGEDKYISVCHYHWATNNIGKK